MWLSLVERHVRDVEAGGSNPLTPTRNFRPHQQTVRPSLIPEARISVALIPETQHLVSIGVRRASGVE